MVVAKRTKWLVVGVLAGLLAWFTGLPAATQAASTASGQDWPMYGHDLANTRSTTGGPARTAIAGLKQRWRVAAPEGDITGTPAVVGGVVYVGSYGGVVRALDAMTGASKWQVKLNGPINASVAVANGVVYVPVAQVAKASKPGSGPFLAAIDASTGKVLWQTTLDTQPDSDVYGSPVVAGNLVIEGVSAFFGENNNANTVVRGGVVALDATIGKVVWHTFTVPPHFTGGGVWSTPAVDTAHGVVYVGTGNSYQQPAASTTDAIMALSLTSGSILASFQATPNDAFDTASPVKALGPDADFGASPNLFTSGSRPLVGEGQKSGVYWAFDPTTLKPVWSQRVGVSSPLGGILGSTAFDGHNVYGPTTVPGTVWSLGAAGAIRWLLPTDIVHYGSVAVSNGAVYTEAIPGLVEVFDTATGVPITALSLGAPSFGGVALAEGAVFAAVGTGSSGNGAVVAFAS
jgi:polyvinyl alcohol dehydrogenase (cytochrome)